MSYAKAVSEGRSNHMVTTGHTEFDKDGNVIKESRMAEIRFMGKDEKHLIIYMNKWLGMSETKAWLAQYNDRRDPDSVNGNGVKDERR